MQERSLILGFIVLIIGIILEVLYFKKIDINKFPKLCRNIGLAYIVFGVLFIISNFIIKDKIMLIMVLSLFRLFISISFLYALVVIYGTKYKDNEIVEKLNEHKVKIIIVCIILFILYIVI